jgi:hypothetical protein
MAMIEEGTYRAKATGHKFGKTSKGTEQVFVEFTVTEGDCQGQRLAWYGYFTEKTTERTLDSLEYCGWDGDSLTDLRGLGSQEVDLVVEHEEADDGRVYARVKWVNRVGGGVKEEMTPAEVQALNARLKGLRMARKQKRANQGGGSDAYGGAPHPAETDDIPF